MTKRKKKSKSSRRNRRNVKPSAGVMEDLDGLRVARRLWASNRLLEARKMFLQLAETYPGNIPTLVDSSRVLAAMHNYDRAEMFLQQAQELGSMNADAMMMIGQSYRIMNADRQARKCFQAAKKLNSKLPHVDLELAMLCERNHELDQAEEHALSELAHSANSPEASCVLARIMRRTKRSEEAIDRLKLIVDETVHPVTTRARASSELAKVYDSLGQFDLAWSAMQAVNRILLKHAKPFQDQRKFWLPKLKKLIDEVEMGDVLAWQTQVESSDQWLPVLLTGLPRSGTTLLAERMSRFSGIACADELDILGRFCFPMSIADDSPESMDRDWINAMPDVRSGQVNEIYRNGMASALREHQDLRIILDKNPSLLPLVLIFLRTIQRGKLLVLLRDPRDVLISSMMAYMPLNQFSIDFLDLESAVSRIEFDLQTWWTLKQKLPAEMWVETDYQELILNEAACLESVMRGLGIDAEPGVQLSSSIRVNSQSYAEVVEPTYQRALGRWKNYQQQLQPVEARLANIFQRYENSRTKAS